MSTERLLPRLFLLILTAVLLLAGWQWHRGAPLSADLMTLVPGATEDPLVKRAEQRTQEPLNREILVLVGHAERDKAIALAARDALRVLELTEQVAAATLLAANQGVWLRNREADARELPPALAAMHDHLLGDFAPVIEDRALESDLRLCLQRIAAQHWRLHA